MWFGLAWNWVDGVFLLMVLLYAWQAFERGLVAVINEMLAWLASWYLGFFCYEAITRNLVIHLGLRANIIRPWSLLATVIASQILIYRGLEELSRKISRHYFGKAAQVIIGVIPALICGLCFGSLMILILLALPLKFPFKTDIAGSVVGLKLLGELPFKLWR